MKAPDTPRTLANRENLAAARRHRWPCCYGVDDRTGAVLRFEGDDPHGARDQWLARGSRRRAARSSDADVRAAIWRQKVVTIGA